MLMNIRKSYLIASLLSFFIAGNLFAADLYWVGNSGDWNDASHWASTSGGAGGAGVPSINDDVHFDKSSFSQMSQNVNIQNDISLRNFTINSNVLNFELKSLKSNSINIYGVLDVNGKFKNELSGPINFVSNSTDIKELNFGDWSWKSDINFDGKGSYSLNSAIHATEADINFNSGELNLNENNIHCGSFTSNSTKKRIITSKNANLYVYKKWDVNPSKLNHDLDDASIFILNEDPLSVNKHNANYDVFQVNYSNKKVITSTSIVTDTASCGDQCDGIIIVNFTTACPTGATVSWNASSNPDPTGDDNGAVPITTGSDTIFDVCPGIEYTATILDDCDNNPAFPLPKATVLGHSRITTPISPSITEPSCNGVCDGSILVFVDAAGWVIANNYLSYQWTPGGVADTTTSLSGMCAGTVYSLQVDDDHGCDTTFTFTITEPDSVYANVVVTDPFCNNECTGSATSNPSGGTGPYSYSWTPSVSPAVDTLATFPDLCAGTAYNVVVTDANGCVNDTTITPNQPLPLDIDTVSTRPSCGGICDATITSTVLSGGTAPFTHNWSNGTVFVGAVSTISNLCPGTYCDTIRDFNGCDTLFCFTITEPDPLLTTTISSNLTCNGICDGFAVTTPTGGTPGVAGYNYTWDSIPTGGPFTGQGTDSISGLCPGTYFVTILDDNNCSVSDTVTITEPQLLVPNPSSTDITCPGFDDGTATVNPTGGTGNPALNFTYSWTGPACNPGPLNTQSINSLCPGTYIVTVTDSAGCIAIDSVTIAEPQVLNLVLTVTPETCAGDCDGTAGVTVTGGTPGTTGYTFLWTSASPIPNGQGTDSIFGLCPDTYTVIVTDSTGCSANQAVAVLPATPIVANLVTSDETCNGACDGIATVSPTGTGPFTVVWDGVLPGSGPGAGPFSINTLCEGAHTALITDGNGCTLLVNFNLTPPAIITSSMNSTDVSCFGLCDGTATTTAGGGSGTLVYLWTPITGSAITAGQGTNSVSSLCSGTYYVTITDDSLCTLNDTIEIFEPNEIFPNATFTNISCNGLNDGTAVSIATGGAPGYSYSWTGPVPFTSNSQSIGPLGPGQYIVTVTDTNGCTAVDTVDIIDPPVFTVSAVATGASCQTLCDGTALATPTGGTPGTTGYTYVWTVTGPPSQTTQTATGLCAGQYTVTVTDSMGCTASDTTLINPLITIQITPTLVGISCNGVCDGTASAAPSGGLAPYRYQWSGNSTGPNDTLASVSNLCPGWIYVTVTDANGCVSLDSVNMPIAPPVLFPNGQIDQQISCFGECDAMVSHNPSGGTPPYVSVWTLPNGVDTNNVCPTFAVITVTDSNNCVQSDTLQIIEPTEIIPSDVVVDVLCNGDPTGSISLNPSGGAGGTYTYVWTGPMPGSGMSTTGLIAGEYTITITDSNGCFVVVTDTINEPPVFSSIPIGIDVSCNGACDGIMAVIPNGGIAPYTYLWGTGQTTDSIFGICSLPLTNLTNSVTVTDSNNCITTQIITINEPLVLDANVSGTSIGCSGALCDGTAIANPLGGTPGYTYQWSTSVVPAPTNLTNQSLSNLCIGSYFVTVTDTNGCTDTATYTVTSPPALVVTLDSTNVTCNGNNDGTATATPTGGTLPYSYAWVGGNAPATDTNFIDNLIPGVYTVTVTDSNNCSFIGSVIITEPLVIDDNEVVTPANCGVADGSIIMFPSGGTPTYTHSWSNGVTTPNNLNLAAGFYTDTIRDSRGCVGIFTIGITNPTGPSGVTATVNDATCFGSCTGSFNVIVVGGTPSYTYAWTGPSGFTGTDSTHSNLCAGTYNLLVTDASGCTLATSLVVGENDSITSNSTFANTSCNGVCDGTASVTPTGGTAPYTYLWGSNGSTGSSISGLCAGLDSVTITDFNGCTEVVLFNILSPNAITINSNTVDPTCNGDCDGTITANPSGGTTPYTYLWNDPSSQTSQTATGLCTGTYIVTVTDFNGCSANDTITLTEPTVIIANDITTNSTCGNSDGTANVCASSGGTGTHTYLWTNVVGNPTTCNVTGLPAGAYTVEITDQNGCMVPFVITISDANGPIVNVTSTNATCDGVCDGTATASATGTPTFTYLWTTPTSPPQPTTPTITGLCAGNYAVEVTDGNGCKTTEPVTISDNTPITATVSTTETTCNGDCDGSALVTPSGGVPPYSYSWTGGNAAGQTINAIGGLCAGSYTVTITDFIGCSFIQNVTITEPIILSVSVAGISANCNGSCDGQATATPAGGTAPYTYLWSTGSTTPTVTALCAGNYSVIITDSKGCQTNGNVIISEGVLITTTINTVDANCGQCDGSITVNGAGGAGGPYTYLWSPGGQTSTTLNNLCPGAYQVDISDNLGCTQQFNILINNVNGPTLTTLADSVTCFGACDGIAYTTITAGTSPFIFQWDDPNLQNTDSATALCAGLYNIVVQDSAGCITVDSVTVLEPQEILTNLSSTEPSCPGVCDGTATVTPTGGIGPYTVSWNSAATIAIAIGGTNTITGLCAGVHTALITDANGCTRIDSVTLTDPTQISITISSTLPTCSGDCDGTAIANASGGTPGYQYSWNTTPVQNNSLIGGLCAGQYIVTVTDNNNCIANDTVQVVDPLVLTTTSTPTSPSCNGVCDGSITTTPNGGVAPYTYIWSNGDTTQTTVSTLCPGIYDVIVVDANNCTIRDTVTLSAPSAINDVTVVTGPSCGTPGCDGSATSTPSGSPGPFNFVWTNLTAPTYSFTDLNLPTSTAVALCAGTYNLLITDVNTGCFDNFTVIVNSLNAPTLALDSTNETCPNICDGTATVNASGGTTPYTYSWNTTPVNTNQTATNLCVGLYTVTVTDSNNCVASDTISINTNSLNLSITSIVPETCFGDCDGSATVAVTGGTPIYTYLWAPTSQTTTQAINLCVGNYTVTVTDSTNCSDSISANITGPNILTVTTNINTPVSCNGANDGAAIANVLGGTPNYQYSWNTIPVQTTQIATGLVAGTYIVTVTDGNGCTAIDTIILTEALPIIDNSVLVSPNCGVCDGSITVAPTGGTGTYTFLWTTPGSPPTLPQPVTATLINLCAGAYTLTVTDTAGCSSNFSYPLSNNNGPLPNVTPTHVSCNGLCDGQLTSAPTQTTPAPPYTYLWSTGTPNNTATISNLCAGQYSVTVTDTNGCVGVAIDSITQPDILQANLIATNLNCNGNCDGTVVSTTTGGTTPYQTYAWTSNPINQVTIGQGTDSISSLCAGTYYLTITDSNTCSVSDSITITEPTAITSTSTQIDATCTSNCDGSATVTPSGGIGPYTFQWNGNTTLGQTNTLAGLCFGLNTVIIFDQNNCNITDSIYIGATDTVLADAGLDTSICLGDVVNLNGVPSGSFTSVEWFELPGMTSLGTTDSVTTTPTTAGVICYAFQATGPCVFTDTVCITVNPLPAADAGADVNIFEFASTTLNATGGSTYSWSPTTGLSDSTIFNPVASPEVTTTYFVTVISADGCIATDSVTVTVLPSINFADGISPNGDGANDFWVIDFIEEFPDNVVEIYNRWGELLFHADGYQQDWDGTYNGKELPVGTYYYIIDLNDENMQPFTGPITILR